MPPRRRRGAAGAASSSGQADEPLGLLDLPDALLLEIMMHVSQKDW